MRSIRQTLAILAALLWLGAAPSSAQDDDLSDQAREGMEQLMRALELFIDRIPQYEAPEMNEDGDIIIRRKRTAPPDEAPEEPREETPNGVEETRATVERV